MKPGLRFGVGALCLGAYIVVHASCSTGGLSSSTDAGTIPNRGSTTLPTTTKSALPTVPSQGGPTLGAVELVTVSYAGSQLDSAIVEFGDYVVTSSWLDIVGAEYGIEHGTHRHVKLTKAAPAKIDADGIGKLLAAAITEGTLPTPTAHTVYMYYAAPETVMTDGDPQDSCSAFSGTYTPAYHYEAMFGQTPFAFGVVPTCGQLTTATLEMSTSHELIEAATDPFLESAPGFIFAESDPWWQTGGEIADICDAQVTRDGHTLTRAWSNVAAAAGANPCVPADTPYKSVTAPQPIMLPLGSTTTFRITGWSIDANNDDSWWVYALPGVYSSTTLSPDIDVAQLKTGEVASVQITAPDDAVSGDVVEMLIYSSTMDQSTRFVRPIAITYE